MLTSARDGAVISVAGLSKTYPVPFLRLKKFFRRKFKPPVEALRNLSFEISEGEIFGLIGPNGAGKTTLTKIIATLVQPTSGAVTVRGHDTVNDDERVRRDVGLSGAEERSFYWRLTAEQNLLFFARLHGLSARAAHTRMAELFDLLELQDQARRRFSEMSTGNKQRLSVARALLSNPPILLLDEPTRSLDPIAAGKMRALIKSLAETKRSTIFLTSHNLAEVEELCGRVAVISHGEIRAVDAPRNLRAMHSDEERVTVVFDGLTPAAAEQSLARAFGGAGFLVQQTSLVDQTSVQFKRSMNDDLLDTVLRVLHESGAIVRSVDIERASLLDVLEQYEVSQR